MAEADYVLGQLRAAVQQLRTLPRPIRDAAPGLDSFWRALEHCLRDDNRAFRVRRLVAPTMSCSIPVGV